MSGTNFPLPTTDAEVTKGWLQVVLASSFPDATFASLEGERIGEAYGYASRIVRYRWKDNRSPQSVVIKLWNTDGKAGKGEVLFYQTFQDIGTRIPNCYYSAYDEEGNAAVLVLEDLQDVVQGDYFEQLDLVRAEGVARSLARLHGTWMDHAKLHDLSWLPGVSIWDPENDWFQSRRTLFLNRFDDRLDGLARALLDRLELAPRVANDRLAKSTTTLLHGDFHLDNFVFEKQIEPVMLDWSRPLKGPLAHNVADLLFEMTALDKFDTVLEIYLEEFNSVAVTSLRKEVLEKQLGGALLRKFTISTCGIALWQPSSPRAVEMPDVGIDRASRAVAFWLERDPELFSFLG